MRSWMRSGGLSASRSRYRVFFPNGICAHPDLMKLGLAHDPGQAEQEPIVVGPRIVETLAIRDQHGKHRAELKQLMPVAIVAGEARGVEADDKAGIAEADFGQQLLKAMARGAIGAEAVVHNPDGSRWVARVNVAPLRDAAGIVVGAINCFQDVTREHEMRHTLASQRRNFDLAMIASNMGTWRYTMADNICVYDENAQRLYGLTEARFIHDKDGVKQKFHPDDMDRMWAGVAEAIDPEGDGRYEVDYRVKQPDGSWRWLSAWGLVEFEGQGAARKPVSITGASRDLSEVKKTEELERLLGNEMNHRVRNTLATVQSIVVQSLRGATDFEAARKAVGPRIAALAAAHELLTDHRWVGAGLKDLIERAIAPFAGGNITVEGPSVKVSPRQALALSLSLHELATNAAKYGALSRPGGRVTISWEAGKEHVSLNWREIGGPTVTPPSRRGFGSRLLTDVLSRDFEGEAQLDFAAEGVRCRITLARSEIIDAEIAAADAIRPANAPTVNGVAHPNL